MFMNMRQACFQNVVQALSSRANRIYMCHAAASPNIIRVPRRIVQKIESLQESRKPVKWRGRVFNARPGKELISSKRKEFNHYQNQVHDKFKPQSLSSSGWKHKRSCGDHFTIMAYRGNPSLQDETDESNKPVDFESFKLNRSLLVNLRDMDIKAPTKIQVAAIPSIARRRNVLFVAETGSGKTLAYGLPIMHLLLSEMADHNVVAGIGRPRCLVLAPTWELAEQIKYVISQVLQYTGLVVRFLDGSKTPKTLRHTFLTPVDIIISTPGPLLNSLRQKFMSLEDIKHVVVDEADTMFDDSFCKSTVNILNRLLVSTAPQHLEKSNQETQLVLAGATMPNYAIETLKDIIPENALDIVTTNYFHRVIPHVNQKFLRLHSQDKAAQILEIVKKDVHRGLSVMIFCNQVPTCNWLAWFLEENHVNVYRLNGDMDRQQRQGVMKSFNNGISSKVLVCTDIVSRGMDTINVCHVVNFDFPSAMADYIHRVGRVGRVGSSTACHVTSFVVHKWDVELVQKIENSVRSRQSRLPKVDANIKRKHLQRLANASTDIL